MDNGPLRSGRKDGRPSTGDADFRTARRTHLPKSRPRRLAPGGFAAPSRRRFPLWMGPNICSRERKAPALGPGAAPDEPTRAPGSSRKYLKVKGIIRIPARPPARNGLSCRQGTQTREKEQCAECLPRIVPRHVCLSETLVRHRPQVGAIQVGHHHPVGAVKADIGFIDPDLLAAI